MKVLRMVVYALLALTHFQVSFAGKILFIFALSPRSHYIVFEPLMLELSNRGHQVVAISPHNISTAVPATMRLISTVEETGKFFNLPRNEDPVALRSSVFRNAELAFTVRNEALLACSALHEMQTLRSLGAESPFDIAFLEGPLNDCLLGFVHQLGLPFVQLYAAPTNSYLSALIGNRLLPSFLPNFLSPFADSFYDYDRLQKRYLGQHVPSCEQILKNATMHFTNSFSTLNRHRPILPNVLELECLQCVPPKDLPVDLQQFVSEATKGLILVSWGSSTESRRMSNASRAVLLQVFRNLEQRVLWKWEDEKISHLLPPNVKIAKWIPNQDVLGHSNTRLFVSHGGLGSLQESLYHSKPLVIIPLLWDQDGNAALATAAGVAESVEVVGMTAQVLLAAIKKVLEEPSYLENAKRLSTVLRDRPDTPLQRSVFWSEYIMRHKGAKHLKSEARNLSFSQFYCLDVFGAIIAVLLILGCGFYLVIKCVKQLFVSKHKLKTK